MCDSKLIARFQLLSISQLHNFYYRWGEAIIVDRNTSNILGFSNASQCPSETFTIPKQYTSDIQKLIIMYGDILYYHEQAGGSWHDFKTISELVQNHRYLKHHQVCLNV